MKKVIALLLVLAMVLTCFVACGKDDKDDEKEIDVVGTYSATLDVQDLVEIIEQLGEDIPDETAEGVEMLADASIEFEVTLELNNDETFEMTVSFDEDAFVDAMIDATIRSLADSNGMTEDEVMAKLVENFGSEDALRDYYEQVVEMMQEYMQEHAYVGTYEVGGDAVFLTDDDSGEVTECTISGKKLTMCEDGVSITFKRQ